MEKSPATAHRPTRRGSTAGSYAPQYVALPPGRRAPPPRLAAPPRAVRLAAPCRRPHRPEELTEPRDHPPRPAARFPPRTRRAPPARPRAPAPLRSAPATDTAKERNHKAARDPSGSGDQADGGPSAIRKTRRRLSVVSDNELVDGVESVQLEDGALLSADDAERLEQRQEEAAAFVISQYAGMSKKGYAPYNPRKKNQDALVMAEDPQTQSLLLIVMDGHGEHGDTVSRYLKNRVPEQLFAHPLFGSDIEAAVAEVVSTCERRMLADAHIDCEFSGTTFVLGVIRGDKLTVANIGDSRIIVGTRRGDAIAAESVTFDHKPDLPLEKKRIEDAGGRVFAVKYDDGIDGPARVWLGNMDVPGLAMSRSLGDTIAHSAGVTSTPEFFTRTVDPSEDCMLIIASDGLWEFMDNQEVIDVAVACEEPRIAVDTLIQMSTERWMREEQVVDDTTVAVAWIGAFEGGGK